MRKKLISLNIKSETLDFIEQCAANNNISRAKIIEVFSEMVMDYFSDNQITTEVGTRKITDGREKG